MYEIRARNVNDAFLSGVRFLEFNGTKQNSRAGAVQTYLQPVATEYLMPEERVLFNTVRDANPVFHIMEALWMLAGRYDAKFLDQFVSDFSERFAEPDGRMHGAYGFRWRLHFDLDAGSEKPLEQLNEIVKLLKENPEDRRIVLTMWDPMADLGKNYKDVPCNTHAYFRVLNQRLHMTVCCRSNDIWWGAYGANAVHFSVLQEYLAVRLGLKLGIYLQFSNNYHYYHDIVTPDKTCRLMEDDPYQKGLVIPTPVVTVPEEFDDEVIRFIEQRGASAVPFRNKFLPEVALPLWTAYRWWRDGKKDTAYELVDRIRPENCDWRVATLAWMQRRMSKMEKVNVGG